MLRRLYLISLILIAVVATAGFYFYQNNSSLAAEVLDAVPPRIYNISADNVTATSASIIWQTDENSDSLVNYGLDSNYGMAREPFFDKKEHKISLSNLIPGATYYYRITSSDAKGNQGISSDFSFITPKTEDEGGQTGTQSGKGFEGNKDGKGLDGQGSDGGWNGTEQGQGWEVEGQNQLTQIVKEIKQITSQETLEQVQQEIQNVAQEISKPPTITIDLANVEVGVDYAIVKWRTDKEANTVVALASEGQYQEGAANPYNWKEGESTEYVLEHEVRVNGLQPATVYHYQVSSQDKLGLVGKSNDGTFRTDSVAPEIYSLRMGKVEETQATILWTTNVPCSSVVEYTNLVNNKTKMAGNSSFFTFHSIQLTELEFDTPYRVIVRVENEDGKKAVSNPIFFTTTKDEVPPVISNMGTESTLYPGSDNKVQTIINWVTDEPAVCQLFAQKGLNNSETEKMALEKDFVLRHVQVGTNFLPATVYKFWVKCQDNIGNEVTSKEFTMLTPSQEKSILDIIISNFESSFGWLKKK